MKLLEHHIKWLEQNDGEYSVSANRGSWLDESGKHVENRMVFVYNSTQISFNPLGLSQAIDTILEIYPESLK